MTTIATDGRRIAADGMTQHHGTIIRNDAYKLRRLPDGSYIGGAGQVDLIEQAIDLLRSKAPAPADVEGEYSLLRLHNYGGVAVYGGSILHPVYVTGPAAIGSGMDFALAAMMAGASPQKAIRIASQLDPNTGGRVTVERIS